MVRRPLSLAKVPVRQVHLVGRRRLKNQRLGLKAEVTAVAEAAVAAVAQIHDEPILHNTLDRKLSKAKDQEAAHRLNLPIDTDTRQNSAAGISCKVNWRRRFHKIPARLALEVAAAASVLAMEFREFQ